MFASRDGCSGAAGDVAVAFTDRYGGVSAPPYHTLDLSSRPARRHEVSQNFALLAKEFDVSGFACMKQSHGAAVSVVDRLPQTPPSCDGLVTTRHDLALCVRVADCVPVLLADPDAGVIGVAHAGRVGVAAGIVSATVDALRGAGAQHIIGWVGPHVCGSCYEVPVGLRREVSAVVPAAFSCTTWGTAALDLGAAVVAQLVAAGCAVRDLSRCTRESPDLYSYRRDGADSGRLAGVVVLRRSVGA
ncbi:MAG: polyphenol oxidase family protein [Sciscionella sp.]